MMRELDLAIAHAAEPFPVMLWRARPDLSCEYLSPQWLEFTGCTEEQALGESWSRGVHPEDLARWLDTCLRAFDAREPFEMEYRLRRRDGEYRWILDRGRPRFADGLFVGFVGACLDIHERKCAEQELARALERERRLRTAIEESSRLKDGFLATVLLDLRSPVQAIATWASHLRRQVPASSDAARALDAIENSARAQDRILSSLLDLSRAASHGAAPLPRTASDEPLLTGVRVLIVDRDPAAREAMSRMLGVAGAQTRAAATVDEALQAVGAFHPDVMLSEVGTRGADGYGLIRSVRSLPAERGGCVRAAALTAPAHAEAGVRAVAAGYDAQLAKPVEPVALLATVARLVQPAGV
jgi:PAS domain S-box-containing protein